MAVGRTLAALCLFLAGPLIAADQAPPPSASKEEPAAHDSAAPVAPAAAGLVVFVDPVTGKLRQPDAAEIRALTAPRPGSAAARGVQAPLEMKSGPGGAVGIVLDSRYEAFMVVTKAPDGRLVTSCLTGERHAAEAAADGAKPAPKAAVTLDEKGAARVP